MQPFPIPVLATSLFADDEAPNYPASPGDMPVFRMPSRRNPLAPADELAAVEVIERLLVAMRAYAFGSEDYPTLVLDELTPGERQAVNETLGEGEVGARVGSEWEAQETAFAGVWRVRAYDRVGGLIGDTLEACAIPAVVRAGARGRVEVVAPEEGVGVMNAPSLLQEIVARAAAFRERGETHTLNLSLLPVTPQDLDYLDTALGRGKVSILSRGYGNCRATATALDGVWWVQYFNSGDTLILNTLEITGMPEVALAAAEDFADSIERLTDCLAGMREGL